MIVELPHIPSLNLHQAAIFVIILLLYSLYDAI